jgi:hypothetical protein
MEKVQVTNDNFNKLKLVEFFLCFFGVLGVFCAMFEYEIMYFERQKGVIRKSVTRKLSVLLAINSFCTLCCVIGIYLRYSILLQWKIEKKMLSPLDTLMTTK